LDLLQSRAERQRIDHAVYARAVFDLDQCDSLDEAAARA
jgi:hypothetical protein